jgi:uncharacterized protein (DUF1501 family)
MLFPVTGAAATDYLTRRPNIGYQQGQGLALTGGPNVPDYELNPAFVNLQSMWDAGEVALVNKVGYPQQNLSHFVSEDIWSYGARGGISALAGYAPGWVARYGNTYAPTNMGVSSIGVGRRLDFTGADANPFLVSSVASFNYRTDFNYTNNHQLRLETIQNILAMQPQGDVVGDIASAGQAAFQAAAQIQTAIADYNAYATANAIQYPPQGGGFTTMGSRLRDIATLIHGGFETRMFYTGYGGFDTHANQLQQQFNLIQNLDNALGVFKQDMITQGVWNDVAVVVISEFGRRNFENGSLGTDHGHGNVVIAVGGALNGGVYGDPITSTDINQNHLGYTTDFRDVYRSLIGDHLGNDPTPLFPEAQPTSSTLTLA